MKLTGEASNTVSENDVETIEEIPEDNGWDGKTTEKVYEDETCKITYMLNSHWDTGYSAKIKVENTGKTTIQDWALGLEGNIKISEFWNVEIILDNENNYIVKNAGWNQESAQR